MGPHLCILTLGDKWAIRMTPISNAKHAMRGNLMDARDKMARDNGFAAAEKASQHALEYLQPLAEGIVIALYWPVQNEIDCRFLLSDLERRGMRIALPVVVTPHSPLEFRAFSTGDELERGVFNTRHPMPDAPKVTPDVMIVPALAFDREGHRIGYGGGFYDRTIALYDKARAIGFAFSGQIINYVPRTDHDRELEAIITDEGVIKINGSKP